MATPSEVKVALDEISSVISSARATILKAQMNSGNAVSELNDIPTRFSDVLSTIDLYGTEDAFEALCKAELGQLTAEFLALVNAGNSIVNTEV